MKYGDHISTLFSSLSTSDTFNYADYAAIKNGSYGKLMKAYYSETESAAKKTSSDKTKTSKTTKETDNTGLAKVKAGADELKSSATKLAAADTWKLSGGSLDMEKISDAVDAFAEDYNAVIKESAKSTSANVKDAAGWMTSLTNTMKDALSKVGITVKSNNTLEVDADTLKNANQKTLKSLLYGSTSYAGQIAQKASGISSAALNSGGLYSSDGTISSTVSGLFGDYV